MIFLCIALSGTEAMIASSQDMQLRFAVYVSVEVSFIFFRHVSCKGLDYFVCEINLLSFLLTLDYSLRFIVFTMEQIKCLH